MVCRKMTIGASSGSAYPTGSFVHSTVTSGSSHVVVRPVSGGSMLRRTAPRRERTVASANCAFEARAHGVGLHTMGACREGVTDIMSDRRRASGESSCRQWTATRSCWPSRGRHEPASPVASVTSSSMPRCAPSHRASTVARRLQGTFKRRLVCFKCLWWWCALQRPTIVCNGQRWPGTSTSSVPELMYTRRLTHTLTPCHLTSCSCGPFCRPGSCAADRACSLRACPRRHTACAACPPP